MTPTTERERQAASRAALADSGGRTVTFRLNPTAAAKLAAWIARGETATGIINKLLSRSKP